MSENRDQGNDQNKQNPNKQNPQNPQNPNDRGGKTTQGEKARHDRDFDNTDKS